MVRGGMTKKKKKAAKGKSSKSASAGAATRAEQAFLEQALAAFRATRASMHAARDPASSKVALEQTWARGDELSRKMLESAEEDEEEPAAFSEAGVRWFRVLRGERTYRSIGGEIRVMRSLYRCRRNGATRCPYEERRGVMARAVMPDLGATMIETYAELPGAAAARLLTRATGHPVDASLLKRFFLEESKALRQDAPGFFDDVLASKPIPELAATAVVSVDALSLLLRKESWKQATVGTITLLDAEGELVRRADGSAHTTRIAEMPEEQKPTIMARMAREVSAVCAQRPDIAIEVVIDGAPDLREKLLALFPDALHVVDFYHVVEHLGGALRLLFPDDDGRRAAEKARWCHKLKHKHGTGFRLWRWLRDEMSRTDDPVASWARREVEKHAEYIYNQREFMQYPTALLENAALGSGAVEAACKTLVTQRLKISGASWSRPGAAGVLYVRTLVQSDRLEDALRYRHRSRHAA